MIFNHNPVNNFDMRISQSPLRNSACLSSNLTTISHFCSPQKRRKDLHLRPYLQFSDNKRDFLQNNDHGPATNLSTVVLLLIEIYQPFLGYNPMIVFGDASLLIKKKCSVHLITFIHAERQFTKSLSRTTPCLIKGELSTIC